MEQRLDVSHLEPCEPLERILEALTRLKKGDFLHIIHRRDPLPLYPMLEKQGFAWRTEQGGPAGYEIFIWHRNDPAADTFQPN